MDASLKQTRTLPHKLQINVPGVNDKKNCGTDGY